MRLKRGNHVVFFSISFQLKSKMRKDSLFQIESMSAAKQFVRNDFEFLLQSFVDENQFPWLDPSLHERYSIGCFLFVIKFNAY